MIDMPTINSIRSKRARGDSIAQISRETGVSEPTARNHLKKELPKRSPKESILDPFKPAIEAILDEDGRTWHKQHHSAKRIYERLVDEYGYEGGTPPFSSM